MGCKKLIEKPSDADMQLFRLGIRVHDNDECVDLVEAALHKIDAEKDD